MKIRKNFLKLEYFHLIINLILFCIITHFILFNQQQWKLVVSLMKIILFACIMKYFVTSFIVSTHLNGNELLTVVKSKSYIL